MSSRLNELTHKLIEAANAVTEPADSCPPELEAAMDAIIDEADDSDEDAYELISDALVEIASPVGAGLMAVWLGAAIEEPRHAAETAGPVAQAFVHWCRQVVTLPEPKAEDENEDDEQEEEVPDPTPDERIVSGLEGLGRSLVTHMASNPEVLEAMRGHDELVQEVNRIEHLSYGAMWVRHVFNQRSGRLLVVEVQQRRGAWLDFQNIVGCFHLFSLIQGALSDWIPADRRPGMEVLAAARGEGPAANIYDSACWHYGQPHVPEADLGASVWGEGMVDSILRIDGQQVLLLWPAILKWRGWDGGCFLPIICARMPAMTLVGALTEKEVDEWFGRLNLPCTERR